MTDERDDEWDDEQDEAHADAYRPVQAEQLVAAHEQGIVLQLLMILDAWRENFPNVFTDEVEALRVKLQYARRFIEEREQQHDQEEKKKED